MQVMNGILANGMQNFIQYVTLFIRNVDNQLDIMINKGGYSKAYAQSTLDQLNFQQITDLLLYILPACHDSAQSAMLEESVTYFEQAKSEYILAFGLFLSFTLMSSFVAGFVVYRRTKKRLLDIENLLALMPLDLIDQKLKQQVEKYLKY